MFSQTTLVSFISLVLLFSSSVHARKLNDWSKACLNGECAYDLPDTNGQSAGALKISGSPDAISDITPAAGWTILDCSPSVLAQDIRLVCSSDESQSNCNHLFRKNGAVGKLVRLPETCGKSAFARVAQYSVSKDQSIPQAISRSILRRSNTKPLVISLHLDTNFGAIDPSVYGDVSIAIQGTTIPGAPGNFTVVPANERRGIFDAIEDAFNDFNNIDISKSGEITPLDIDKDFPIYSNSISCPGPPAFTASINVDVDTTAKVVISFGVAAVGTIIPPKLTEFGLFAALDANLDAILGVKGNVAGTESTGEVTLFSILTLGPTFKIVGELSADFDTDVDLQAELSYSITNARIMYPRSSNTASSGTYAPSSGPLKLSVSGNEASSMTVNALVSPRIDVGLDALDGIATATVNLQFDATASANLDLTASGSAGTTVNTTTGTTTGTAVGNVNGCVTVDAGVSATVGADASFFGLFDESGTLSLFKKDWELYSKCFTKTAGVARRSVEQRAGLSCPSASASALVNLA
ncbi:hypothetical protein C0995_005930 [Termitomyces sp. Mi166|nr:hypothetical protein C0995_005930 [Termitomyces sp. Mi166\